MRISDGYVNSASKISKLAGGRVVSFGLPAFFFALSSYAENTNSNAECQHSVEISRHGSQIVSLFATACNSSHQIPLAYVEHMTYSFISRFLFGCDRCLSLRLSHLLTQQDFVVLYNHRNYHIILKWKKKIWEKKRRH